MSGTVKISTASGFQILIDESDLPLVSAHSWWTHPGAGTHYAKTGGYRPDGRRTSIFMHRLLMNPPLGMVVHHINANGLDNRRLNLRIVTPRENTVAHYDLKPSGVHQIGAGRWRARTRIDGMQVSLGIYNTKEDALSVVDAHRTRQE